ncbi:glycoside hydrolase family 3 N-terminal domain-containing protein [Cytophagaceae bacterium ABcell3]|nr:glycoside hydrolase family 3 N-terminal domain-containing protein [Cytophagaceae bacterium ABcell3]
MLSRTLFFLIVLSTGLLVSCSSEQNNDPVENLLSQMTLEEKIGQMTQLNITTIMSDSIQEHYDSVTTFVLDTNKLIDFVKNHHVGSFLNGRGVDPENWFEYINGLQRTNMKHSRLKIPIIYGVDHVHGSSYLNGGTIFPHNINLAATFDTTFAYETGKITVIETADLGHSWLFAPVLDLGRNKFWGRYYETFGEDPMVTAEFGTAFVNGIQNCQEAAPYKVAACAKHFIGYSDPKSGWDRSPAEIPDQALREFFLPAFQKAINAGVKTVMINSGEINGIPVHANKEILTGLLRKELGFEGVAVTDWLDIIALEKMHFVAENEKEATFLAIDAGIDMSMVPYSTSFCKYLKELVEEGRISEERIDQSVRRILKLKMDLGLFDNPYPRNDRFERIGAEEHKKVALNAARESIVLVKNEKNVLPLQKDIKKIVLAGPNADRKVPLCGGWTYRFAPQSDIWFPKDMPTIYSALTKELENTTVELAELSTLSNKAVDADVVILALGEETAYAETDGSIDDLELPEHQIALAKEAFMTGKPVILLLTEGRPLIIHKIADRCDGIIFAGLPGNEGATAIAEIISGNINPSGKMSFTYPWKQGHVIPYNHKRSEFSELRPVSEDLQRYSLIDFGQGLSYTNFEYSDITISDTVVSVNSTVKCQVTVTNTGNRVGKESVLWFVSDEVASITRPIKELKHFEKQQLKPGESKTFTFAVNPWKHLSFPDKHGDKRLEEGYFTISTGEQTKRFKLELQ